MADRINCPMRHLNGNCLVCGGFCASVVGPICESLRCAYESGYLGALRDMAELIKKLSEKKEG